VLTPRQNNPFSTHTRASLLGDDRVDACELACDCLIGVTTGALVGVCAGEVELSKAGGLVLGRGIAAYRVLASCFIRLLLKRRQHTCPDKPSQ
jgi:hypothetical protein